MKEQARTHCIRCGECCRKSSPTLQFTDISLVKTGPVKKADLYTIRKGELVRDNINESLIITRNEIIKIREKEGRGGECAFYDSDGKTCAIYEQRPAQCAALKCWDTSEFMKVYGERKLERRDIIEDGVLLGMIEEHERRCGYISLKGHVKLIEKKGEKALKEILALLRFDYQLRPFISKKLGLDKRELDFYFGRPLIETITMFGLQVIREDDGTFMLIKSRKPVR